MSFPMRFAGRILRFNRLVRILISILIALGWTLLLTMLSQMVLGQAIGTGQSGNGIFYVFVVVAIIIYWVGWRLIVGPMGKPPQAGTAAGWYSLLGILAFIASIVLVVVALMVINQTI